MTFKRWAAVAAMLALAVAASAEERPMQTPEPLGVQVPWTPAPSGHPRPEQSDAAPEGEAEEAQEALPERLGTRVLRKGLSGEDVSALQRKLRELGYLQGEPDGLYGRQTVQAVEAYQRDQGLSKVDGKAGQETLQSLFGASIFFAQSAPREGELGTAVPTATPSPVVTPTPDVQKLPFEGHIQPVYLGEQAFDLVVGVQAPRLYPLCGVMMHMGYATEVSEGTWTFSALGRETISLMAQQDDGRFDGAIGAIGSMLFVSEEPVYVYGNEVWAGGALLRSLGLHLVETDEITVIW